MFKTTNPNHKNELKHIDDYFSFLSSMVDITFKLVYFLFNTCVYSIEPV